MYWFLEEQLEEIASMTTLLDIAARAENRFDFDCFVARAQVGDGGHGLGAPQTAGGAV